MRTQEKVKATIQGERPREEPVCNHTDKPQGSEKMYSGLTTIILTNIRTTASKLMQEFQDREELARRP